MFKKLKAITRNFKSELKVYKSVMTDSRTPRVSKFLLKFVIVYLLSPVDLIPDFIPVIGFIDDAIVAPTLIFIAIKLIPKEVITSCREKVYVKKGER